MFAFNCPIIHILSPEYHALPISAKHWEYLKYIIDISNSKHFMGKNAFQWKSTDKIWASFRPKPTRVILDTVNTWTRTQQDHFFPFSTQKKVP